MATLQILKLPDFKLKSGIRQPLTVSYRIYGRPLHTAPIILVNHALTANAVVTKWWSSLIGNHKLIDLDQFTVVAIDIPGNGATSKVEDIIYNYKKWSLYDVAIAYLEVLKHLKISTIKIGIGGSIGGCLLWEMLAINKTIFEKIIPIAAHYTASQWLKAVCHVQESILNNSSHPIEDARKHAMTLYRSPVSLQEKFSPTAQRDYDVKQWLDYHGTLLKSRLRLPSYLLLNHLLASVQAVDSDEHLQELIRESGCKVRVISINSDGLFPSYENVQLVEKLKGSCNVSHHQINSIHGHDAFLLEYDQLETILKEDFEVLKTPELQKI